MKPKVRRNQVAADCPQKQKNLKIPAHYYRALSGCRPLALLAIVALAPVLASAQQLTPLFGNAAGVISQVASVQVAKDQIVTAVINSTGNLEVIAWYANLSTKQLVRQGTWVAGPLETYYAYEWPAVAISSPYSLNAGLNGVFTTAAINSNGNLDVIYWKITPQGAISPISESTLAGTATAVSVASVYSNQAGDPQFMTAIRNGSGDLQLSLWYVDPTMGVTLSGNGYAGAVNAVSIACLQDLASDVITAVSNSLGELEVIRWYYGRFGEAVSRGNTVYTGNYAYYNVAVAPGVETLNNPPDFVNAFYTAAPDNLTTVSAWNQDIGVQGSATAGGSLQIGMIAHGSAAVTASTPYTPILYENGGTYSLWAFDQTNSNGGWGQVASASGAYATSVSIALVDTSSPSILTFAVAYRNSLGNLQIELWNYTQG